MMGTEPQGKKCEAMDGLIKEVLKDQANGLWGKTVIHPSHIPVVNALQSVFAQHWIEETEEVLVGPSVASAGATERHRKLDVPKP